MKEFLLKLFFGEQYWLIKAIPKEHADKDLLIEIVLFESLIHFVENEDNLQHGRDIAYYVNDMQCGYFDMNDVQKRIEWRQALYDTYNYLKHERKQLEANPNWKICITEVAQKDKKAEETIMKFRDYMWI